MSLSTRSKISLNIPRDGDATTSLSNLFQCLTTLSENKFLLISNLNLPWCSLRPLPLVSLTSVPCKTMEKIILGVTEEHLKDNAVIGHRQHRLMRGKSSLMNFISFSDKVSKLVKLGKPADIIFSCPRAARTFTQT